MIDQDDRRFYHGSRWAEHLPRRVRVWLGGKLWRWGTKLSSIGQGIMPDHVWARSRQTGSSQCTKCLLWASEDSGYPCSGY